MLDPTNPAGSSSTTSTLAAPFDDAPFLKRRGYEYVTLPTSEQMMVERLKASAAARLAKLNAPAWMPPGPFRFFELPSELRIRILEFALVLPDTVDVDGGNRHAVAPRLSVFRVSRRMHEEAYHVFFGRNTFRVFVTEAMSFRTKKVLLTRLSKRYRNAITTLELRLGPGWSDPPKTWLISPKLGLVDCVSVRRLRVFVQLDPSDDMFKGFRKDPNFYTIFSSDLLRGILTQVPTITDIEFDGYNVVSKTTPLMTGLLNEANTWHKRILWGTEKDWDAPPPQETDMARLQNAIAELSMNAQAMVA